MRLSPKQSADMLRFASLPADQQREEIALATERAKTAAVKIRQALYPLLTVNQEGTSA